MPVEPTLEMAYLFAPRTCGAYNDPVLLAGLVILAPANDGYDMVDALGMVVVKDTCAACVSSVYVL
jgi:hypothetical protein